MLQLMSLISLAEILGTPVLDSAGQVIARVPEGTVRNHRCAIVRSGAEGAVASEGLCRPGDYVFGPRNVPHAFANKTAEAQSARMGTLDRRGVLDRSCVCFHRLHQDAVDLAPAQIGRRVMARNKRSRQRGRLPLHAGERSFVGWQMAISD
jgi:hypothetical protein